VREKAWVIQLANEGFTKEVMFMGVEGRNAVS
jgi:hypothetical protein